MRLTRTVCVGLAAAAAAMLARPAPTGAQTAATQPAASQPAAATRPAGGIALHDGQRARPLSLPAGEDALPYGKVLAYAAVILLLAAGALLAGKKLLPRLNPRMGGRQIRLAETFYLGPRKQLHVVEVGGQRFLLASCRDGMSMLAELHGTFDETLASCAAAGEGEA